MSDISKKKRLEVHEKCNSRCAYCGSILFYEEMHIDHLIPQRKGAHDPHHTNFGKERGGNNIENLMPTCASCNISKYDRTLEEWRTHLNGRLDMLHKSFGEYRVAKRFGLIIENRSPVVFYFERMENGSK